MLNPIALSIPGFFVLIGAELLAAKLMGCQRGPRPAYRAVEVISSLACGISSQTLGLLLGPLVFAASYTAVYAAAALWQLPDTLPVWIGAFVAVDFLYYLWHRASHRVGILWAAHVVHHQSEDYNLAIALRQAIFTTITAAPFYLPLAVLGVSPLVFLTCNALNTVYQFWIHTRLVGRLGPLELVLNTPSHHRVHHGINPRYIDRNHAGVFIVWDRLFGTFEPEGEEPVYGVVEGFESADSLRANLAPLKKLLDRSLAARGLDRLRVWVAPPEWRTAAEGGPQRIPTPSPTLRFDPPVEAGLLAYIAAWLVVVSITLTALLLLQASLPAAQQGAAGGLILWTLASWGWLLDRRPGAQTLELLRLLCLPIGAFVLSPLASAAALVLSLLSLGVFIPLSRRAEIR
jgi:alkylglycerol monooxygenase